VVFSARARIAPDDRVGEIAVACRICVVISESAAEGRRVLGDRIVCDIAGTPTANGQSSSGCVGIIKVDHVVGDDRWKSADLDPTTPCPCIVAVDGVAGNDE